MSDVTQSAASGLSVEHGQVVRVNARNRTIDVQTQGNIIARDVPCSPFMQHPDHQGGIHFIPEMGAQVKLGRVDERTWTVLAYTNSASGGTHAEVDDDGNVTDVQDESISYGANRMPLEPGDIHLSTRDGNQIKVLTGGIIQVYSTALANMTLIPVDNIVRFCFQKLQMRSVLGEIDWDHAAIVQDQNDPDDPHMQTGVRVRYNIKELAQENVQKHHTVEVRVGRLDDSTLDKAVDNVHMFRSADVSNQNISSNEPKDMGVVSMAVWSHGVDGQQTPQHVFSFQVNRSGNAFFRVRGNLHLEVDEVAYVYSAKEIRAQVEKTVLSILKGLVSIDAGTGKITLKASAVELTDGTASLTVQDGTITLGGNVRLGTSAAAEDVATYQGVSTVLQTPGAIAVIVPSAVGALSPAGKLGFTNIAKARPKKVQA